MSTFLLKSPSKTIQKYWVESKIETSIPLTWLINFYHYTSEEDSSRGTLVWTTEAQQPDAELGLLGLQLCYRISYLFQLFHQVNYIRFISSSWDCFESWMPGLQSSANLRTWFLCNRIQELRKGCREYLAEPLIWLKISPISSTYLITCSSNKNKYYFSNKYLLFLYWGKNGFI